jgi:hypothetical protein
MNAKSNSPAMGFIMAYLREHGDTEYAVVRTAAEKAGHTIYPIMYGRAKALLGMIPPDAPKRRRRPAQAGSGAGGESAPSRPLRQGGKAFSEATAEQLQEFLKRYREVEGERNRLRAALANVERLLKQALEGAVE